MRLGDLDALKKSILARLDDDEARISEIVEEEIDNVPTVELFCSYLSDGEVRQPCVEAPCSHERPQGEWIKIFENPFTSGYICPFCGHRIQVTEQFLPQVTECEVCGAELKGGSET